jgi:hypothetical protein
MKRLPFLTLLLGLPLALSAQPIEEEILLETPTYEIEVIEAPTPTVESTPMIPLGDPKPVNEQLTPAATPQPVASETTTASGTVFKFSPAVALKPLGYQEGNRFYTTFSPSASLSADFGTASGKTVAFSLGYTFIWQEFLDKTNGTDRYFEHDTALGLGYDFSDNLSGSLDFGFNYSLRANPNDREFTILSSDSATMTYKVNDQFSTKFGIAADIFVLPDGAILSSSQGIPSDADDIQQGNFGLDPGLGGSNDDIVLFENTYWVNNQLVLGGNYKAPSGTGVGLTYNPVLYTFTNDSSLDWRGHVISLSLSQDAPWEGGSFSLTNQLRLRGYQATTIDSGELKRDQRNRLTLAYSQKITDNVSGKLWYRWQMTSNNGTDEWTPANYLFVQTSFSF